MKKLKNLWKVPEIRAYLIANVLLSLSTGWFFGIYTVFLNQKVGLSLAQANLVNTVFMLLSTVFDPYTGKLADKYGQKKIYIWGQAWWALGMLIYGFAGNFGQAILAESAAAIGHALMSQALETWLRNRLGEDLSHQAISQQGTTRLANIPTAMAGSLIGARFGLEWPWRLAGLMGLVATIVCAKVLKKLPDEGDGHQEPTISEAFRLMAKNKGLRRYIVVIFAYSLAVQPINMFWGAILAEKSGTVAWLGSLWLPISILFAWGGQLAEKRKDMKLAIAITAIPILIATAGGGSLWLIVGGFLVHEIGRGMISPLFFTLTNRHIPNHIRSTASSIVSAGRTAGNMTGLLISAYLSLHFDPVEIWMMAGGWLIVMAIWLQLAKE